MARIQGLVFEGSVRCVWSWFMEDHKEIGVESPCLKKIGRIFYARKSL